MERKAYIGDSVYAEIDTFGAVVLTTENGYPDDPRNRIVLEPETLAKLQQQLVVWAINAVRFPS